MKKVMYYFDFLSPYSYIAWNWVKKCQSDKNFKHEIEFIPVILGSIITSYETKGPAEITPKRNYLFKDCLRFTASNNIPFTTPKQLPFNSLYALRLALKDVCGSDNQYQVINAIFEAGWSKGEDIGSPEFLEMLMNDLGLNGKEMLDRTSSKEARKQLKLNVKDALGLGVFGLPTFIIDEELFWGNDSIVYIEQYLENNDPLEVSRFKEFLHKHPF